VFVPNPTSKLRVAGSNPVSHSTFFLINFNRLTHLLFLGNFSNKLHEKGTVLFSPAYALVSPRDLAKMHKEIWGPKERSV